MRREETVANALENRNVDWNLVVTPDKDGIVPGDQITNALLLDIREAARSVRRMMLFFTILAVINCAGVFFWLANALTK
jgi:hypothetical protein